MQAAANLMVACLPADVLSQRVSFHSKYNKQRFNELTRRSPERAACP
jgi:hypothetical protein